MGLHNGIDTVAVASLGVYSETYGSTGQANINNLFGSLGLLEDAPSPSIPSKVRRLISWWIPAWNKLTRKYTVT